MTDFKFNDMQIEFAMLAVSVEFSGLPIVFVFCRFVFRLISTFERSMIRVETHFRYQFSLFLENSIIYHSNYSCSLTRVSLISLVALVPCRPTPFSLVLTQLNLVQSFSSFLVNNVIPKGVFGLAALFYDCKLNVKFAMKYSKFARSFMDKLVIKLDRYVLCFVFVFKVYCFNFW